MRATVPLCFLRIVPNLKGQHSPTATSTRGLWSGISYSAMIQSLTSASGSISQNALVFY
jgi:hypothetical protein